MNYKGFFLIGILLLLIPYISAFDFPHTIVNIDYTGNLTNLSELLDTNIPAPTDNYVLSWDDGTSMWIAESPSAVGDTNETTRFNTLVGTNCGAGEYAYGVDATGLVECRADEEGNSTFNQTLTDSLYATIGSGGNTSWNESYANTLYADISVTGDNSSWTQVVANGLYAILGYGDDWNKTYADTLYAGIGTGNNSFNQTLTDSLYYLITNPFGFYNSSNFNIANYYLISNPFGFYNSTSFPYTHLSNFTDDLGDRGYTSNLNFTNDAIYWNDTYATFNKTYADTLYAGISSGNSSFNQSLTDTLYYGISNPYGFWNSTFALFNKTYADTLYYDLGNSYGYYNSTSPQPDSNYTEDEIEAFIFDDDNTAELNMSGYNITGINHLCMNSDCSSYIWYNGTGILIQG